jgi:hypothetical protein
MTDPPKSSVLGEKISKTGRILTYYSNSQLEKFQLKVQQNSLLYQALIKNVIIDKFDKLAAIDTSKEFFKKDSINFAAIDGTEYAKQFFDMVIFYAGAYTCSGRIDFKDSIKVKYDEKFLNNGREISSCVPVYINKIPDIDTSFYSSQNTQKSILDKFSEEAILDNTNISKSLMTFSEFFLAYKLAASKQTDLIFMDRSLSNMYSSLLYDTSKKSDWRETSSLLNYKLDGVSFDENDFTLARYNVLNEILKIPPCRGDYLRYSVFFKILEKGSLDFDSLCSHLEVDSNDKQKIDRVKKYLDRWINEKVIENTNNQYSISEKYKSNQERIRKLVNSIGNQIFDSEKDPFTITKEINGERKKQWITTTDLAFLTLFAFYLLIEECWKNNVFLIGITKDTIARDFSNHLLPIGIENSLWECEKQYLQTLVDVDEDGDNTVYSDRMLLQTISLMNRDSLHVPWSIIEYDSAFVLAIPDLRKRKGYVSGAIKNKITTNKLFLRSFVQLEEAKTDNRLRSNVLFIDRLVYPEFDIKTAESITEFIHDYNGDHEKVDFLLYKDNKAKNPLQNIIISILKSMSTPSIAESFGYNKALFIADKVAKWHNQEFRNIVDSTTLLISNKKNMRNYLFYMSSFREKRQEFESNRRR